MIAICGAGIGGLSCALFLIDSGAANICIYEGRSEETYYDLPSGGLGLAANGMKVLQRLGLDEQVAAGGFRCNNIELRHCSGSVIGCLPNGSGLMISRKVPHLVLLDKLAKQGIKPICGRRAISVNQTDWTITFADGSTSPPCDIIIDASGIGSPLRKIIVGEGYDPVYSGLVGTGGFLPDTAIQLPSNEPRCWMYTGPTGFFGFTRCSNDSIMWWSMFEHRDTSRRMETSEIKAQLLRRQSNWPYPIPTILSLAHDLPSYPVYSIPPLPTYHKGRLVAVGDAKTAMPPHSGQGLSMALEDALHLVSAINTHTNLDDAFTAYEHTRKPRVDKIVANANRQGQSKLDKSWAWDAISTIFARLFFRFIFRDHWLDETLDPPLP